MSRVYENPPIVEAVCEFRFQPSQTWDWTIPGLVYDKVKHQFPQKRQQAAVQVELRAEEEKFAQSVRPGVVRMQFVREDGRALIQVGPNLLSVNHLKPYPKWGVFKHMIHQALEVYWQVTSPQSFRRIGLRYINRIEMPANQVKIEDYLLSVPTVPKAAPQTFAGWAQRVEIPFENMNGMLVLQSGNLHEEGQMGIVFLLDLDFITLRADRVTSDSAAEWVERAHSEVESTFEACVTDKARELFGDVKGDFVP